MRATPCACSSAAPPRPIMASPPTTPTWRRSSRYGGSAQSLPIGSSESCHCLIDRLLPFLHLQWLLKACSLARPASEAANAVWHLHQADRLTWMLLMARALGYGLLVLSASMPRRALQPYTYCTCCEALLRGCRRMRCCTLARTAPWSSCRASRWA